MDPKIWGPYLWTSLLYIVLNYPDSPTIDTRHDYRQFFLSLGQVLPCVECRKNYCDHLKVIPIDPYLDGRVALLNWLWRVYNQINDFCGKTRLTMKQFLTKYLKPADLKLIPSLAYGQKGGGFSQNPAGFLGGLNPPKNPPGFWVSSNPYFWLLVIMVAVLFFTRT